MFSGMLVAAAGFYLTMRAMVVDASWKSLVLPFAVSGFGIGMVMPVMTSAVMGSVPVEKAGQASGVISSMRQIGSVLGIAVMGAVLQNRAVTYMQAGVATKLDSAPIALPPGVKQQIIDAVGTSAINMGQLQAGGGLGGSMPSQFQGMLSQLPAQAVEFFKSLFSRDFIMGEFVHAMRTTYMVSIVLVLVGALLCLAVSGRIKKRRTSGL
jgi:MFS family permease